AFVNLSLCSLPLALPPRLLLERRKDFLGRSRQRRDPDSNGIVDGVDDRRRRRNEGRLTDALGPERAVRIRILDDDRIDLRNVERGRQNVLREPRGRRIAVYSFVLFHKSLA